MFRSLSARCQALLLLTLLLSACADGQRQRPQLIQIDGSSTVYPIIEAMVEEFQIARQGTVQMTVGISGSGGGFKKFCRGELDITNASRPIAASEMADCRAHDIGFIELPLAYDAITIVVHPDNNWLNHITTQQLKSIWQPAAQETLLSWDQLDSSYPAASLNLYGAGPDSGTFDYFTAVIVGRSHASRGDYTASEDDNLLVRGVASDRYALGYFGLAYYFENRDKLRAVPVVNAAGEPVLPTSTAVQNGVYRPLARPVFLYISLRAAQRPVVQDFIHYMYQPRNRQEIISWVGYVPLTAPAYDAVMARFDARTTGSLFSDPQTRSQTVDQVYGLAVDG
ncbi:MAG: PstS family phosphate ABC transporter substrate-binding protein [Wenzhouxiangellaceae bacterium]